jgi:hypothetical protein
MSWHDFQKSGIFPRLEFGLDDRSVLAVHWSNEVKSILCASQFFNTYREC